MSMASWTCLRASARLDLIAAFSVSMPFLAAQALWTPREREARGERAAAGLASAAMYRSPGQSGPTWKNE